MFYMTAPPLLALRENIARFHHIQDPSDPLYCQQVERLQGLRDRSPCNLHLTACLGNAHLGYECVHVAGTNGKGSVSLKIATGLRQYGVEKVGLFTSPHLFSVRERLVINGEIIPVDQFLGLLQTVTQVAEANQIPLKFFPCITNMAFLWFAYHNVDIAVIETGLGGRKDATNIISTPTLVVITSIGFDHMRLLGSTLEKIAAEKAAIIKDHSSVILGPEAQPRHVFENEAAKKNAHLICIERCEESFNEENTRIALKALSQLQLTLGLKPRHLALTHIEQAYRYKILTRRELQRARATLEVRDLPEIVIDVGHNTTALLRLADSLMRDYNQRKGASTKAIVVLFALSHDRTIEIFDAFVDKMEANGFTVPAAYYLPLEHELALPVATILAQNGRLASRLRNATNDFPCVKACIKDAVECALSSPTTLMLFVGSVYAVEEVNQALGLPNNDGFALPTEGKIATPEQTFFDANSAESDTETPLCGTYGASE